MKTLVMKFGGTSVGSVDALRQAAAIVCEHSHQWEGLVVVVSAMSGVTDMLLKCASAAVKGNEDVYALTIDQLRVKHRDVVDALVPEPQENAGLKSKIDSVASELGAISRSVHVLGEITPRGLDAISSQGERLNAALFSALLREMGVKSQAVDATKLIQTNSQFQNAHPNMQVTRKLTRSELLPLLEEGCVPVVTGFLAANEEGVVTTLGRGGSDYTSAILGDALDAEEVWTWTDVDGVMTADPRIVSDARVIPFISFSEVGELAYFGAKVLHPKTIRPIVERNIPLWVKNTFNPTYPGTRISKAAPDTPGKITAITSVKNLSIITVEGRGMLGVPGIAARTFAAVARTGASVLMISQASSEQSICFTILTDHSEQVIESLEEEMKLELMRQDIDRISSRDDVVNLSVIGSKMRETPGISARIFGALGRENINVLAIAQGSSDYSLSLVVSEADADQAVRAIHKEVVENGGKNES